MARKKKEPKEENVKKPAGAAGDSGETQGEGEEEKKESIWSKILLVFVTLIVIALWLAIIALLIKLDLGGFGSEVLRPILKDVPVINRILPEGEEDREAELETEVDTQYMYDSLDEAIAQIKLLEQEIDSLSSKNEKQKDTIADLKAQISDLSKYKEEQAEFLKEKEKFYEEVVYNDKAPDIEQYRQYYELIEPENAAVLYKQVVEQTEADAEIQDYVATYSSMKPASVAKIFNAMTDDLELVSKILSYMSSQARGDIVAQMDVDVAARITEIMDPEIAEDVRQRLIREAAQSGD